MAKKRHKIPPATIPKGGPAAPAAKSPAGESSRSLDELAKLTGIPAALIRYSIGEGFVPRSEGGRYLLGPSLLGLIKFFHARYGRLPTYENAAQCATATGLPLAMIRQAVKAAPGASRHGIDLGEILKVIGTVEEKTDYRGEREKYAAMRERVEAEHAAGLTLDREAAGRGITKAVSMLFAELDRQTQTDLPADLNGCGEELIRSKLQEMIERLKTDLQKRFSEVLKK